ncbi:hypothetical protein NADE_003183 [Nannochloris sp. 'desiccata']|jgi:hypothetical protein|nr:hypothetical protein NADE_003183 [Chlorella desiccata (nom. nud.)]
MVGKDIDSSNLGKLWHSVEQQGLSEYSYKNYRSSLNVLIDMMSEEAGKQVSLEWVLSHPERTVQRLCALYPNTNTQKTMLGAILSVFKYNKGLLAHDGWRKHKEIYYAAFRKMDEVCREFYDSLQMTEREKQGWVDWADIVKMELELRRTSYATFEHLLLAMYVLLGGPGKISGCPLRADFNHVRLCHKDLPIENEESYLNLYEGKLVLKTYKTAKHYGHLVRQVPQELLKIIEKSLEKEPRDYLFVDSIHGKPYIKNSFTKQCNRTLKYLFGKPLTIRLIRQAFISSLNFSELTPGELRGISKAMCHNTAQQGAYRRRAEKKPAAVPQPEAETTAQAMKNFRRKKGPLVTVIKSR